MELFLESIKMDWPVLTPIFICSILSDIHLFNSYNCCCNKQILLLQEK